MELFTHSFSDMDFNKRYSYVESVSFPSSSNVPICMLLLSATWRKRANKMTPRTHDAKKMQNIIVFFFV